MGDTLETPVDQQVLNGTEAAPAEPRNGADVKPERKRDANGRWSTEAEDELALDKSLKEHLGRQPAKVEPKEPAAEPAKDPKQTPVASPAKVKAMKALELDGFSEEDLATLSEERILALGDKAHKRQSDIGKKLSERAKTEAPATAAPAEAAKETKPQAVSTQATYKELVKGVGELLGDDVGEALSGVLEKAVSPLVERLNRAEGLLQQRLEAEMDVQIGSLRGKLAEEFPPLKDDAVLQRVVESMGQLADPEKHSSLEDVMRAACKLELFDDMVKAAAPAKKPNDTSRNNGQATTATAKKPASAMSREELEDAALDEAFKKNGLSR